MSADGSVCMAMMGKSLTGGNIYFLLLRHVGEDQRRNCRVYERIGIWEFITGPSPEIANAIREPVLAGGEKPVAKII